MLFKKQKKRKYFSRIGRVDGFEHTSTSGDEEVSSDEILSMIEWLYKRDGKVVIDFINEDTIQLTSLETVTDRKIDDKLVKIKNLIKENL